MKDFEQLRGNIDDSAIALYFHLQDKGEPVYCVTYKDDVIIIHLDGENTGALPTEWQGWQVNSRKMV